MKLSLEIKGLILGAVSALTAIGMALAAGEIIQSTATGPSQIPEKLVVGSLTFRSLD